jgi:glutathione synthase/RimK-type ligase-like ATP-grasp enzyme
MSELLDLGVAWDWAYDREFIVALEWVLRERGMVFYSVTHDNLHTTLELLRSKHLSFRAFLDRASDTDEKFLPLAQAVRLSGAVQINPHEALRHAADKATMHLEFLTRGLNVPYTLIISPYNVRREVGLSLTDLARLGRPFIIKPANTTGGGIGVILGAETLKDVIESRQHHKNDKYLLQEKIDPEMLDGKIGWFRVFWIFGTVIPCWWHPETHRYEPVTEEDLHRFALYALHETTAKIQEVCKLDFFSTEIALHKESKLVVVDYVNEVCDMRMQSTHVDGVPDVVVMKICESIANHLKSHTS